MPGLEDTAEKTIPLVLTELVVWNRRETSKLSVLIQPMQHNKDYNESNQE